MAEKRIGLGTTFYVDHDNNLTFTKIGQIKDLTPPTETIQGVDDTDLDATLMTEAPGIEELSEFRVTQFYHDGDSNHQLIDDLFASRAEVEWRYVLPYSTPQTKQFSGWVKGKSMATIVKDDIMQREIVISRTSDITTV